MAAKLSGGGGGKYAIEQNSEINVTPFVDIMLVLLIIFMVAAPLATVSVEVKLPSAPVPPATPPPYPTDWRSSPKSFHQLWVMAWISRMRSAGSATA